MSFDAIPCVSISRAIRIAYQPLTIDIIDTLADCANRSLRDAMSDRDRERIAHAKKALEALRAELMSH